MKLSTKGKYGIRAMVDLAENFSEEPVSIKTISERQGVSEYYLEQLFSSLKKANLIKSVRGAKGGYFLTKPPRDIKISEIMNVLEGDIEIAECASGAVCNGDCATRVLWVKIKNSIDTILEETTLQQIIDEYNTGGV